MSLAPDLYLASKSPRRSQLLAEAGIAPVWVARLTRRGIVTGRRSAARTERANRLGAMLARMAERGRASAGPTLGA